MCYVIVSMASDVMKKVRDSLLTESWRVTRPQCSKSWVPAWLIDPNNPDREHELGSRLA